jgi:hypothetical protein
MLFIDTARTPGYPQTVVKLVQIAESWSIELIRHIHARQA